MIRAETVTVYHGGGRRWFTLKAAARREAGAKLKERCTCDYVDHPEYGQEDLPCGYHDGSERAAKILRRLARLHVAAYRAAPAPKEPAP